MTVYPGEDVEKGDQSYTAGVSANLYSHFGNQYGNSSGKWESVYHKIQQFHSQAYTQMKLIHTSASVQLYSQQHYL